MDKPTDPDAIELLLSHTEELVELLDVFASFITNLGDEQQKAPDSSDSMALVLSTLAAVYTRLGTTTVESILLMGSMLPPTDKLEITRRLTKITLKMMLIIKTGTPETEKETIVPKNWASRFTSQDSAIEKE